MEMEDHLLVFGFEQNQNIVCSRKRNSFTWRTFHFSERMKTTEQEMFILGREEHVTKCSHAISGAAKAMELNACKLFVER